jgi:BirA family biotin operon repressor/biotin-[acetyl-CoA-carboxylase] ligase
MTTVQQASSDLITAELIQRELRTAVLGHPAIHLPSTTSTNTIAHELARAGARDGTVVITDHQTRGRGRLERAWISPPGEDLLFSLILRPSLSPDRAFQVTAAASLAVAHAIRRETGLDARIKWPNDIYIKEKKASGILTELGITGTQMEYAVIGIGINVNSYPTLDTELRKIATSLRLETGRNVDRLALLAAILEELEQFYERLKGGEFAALKIMWDALSLITGRQITITTGDARHQGVAESVDDDGTLIVRDRNGGTQRFVCGDVSLSLRGQG